MDQLPFFKISDGGNRKEIFELALRLMFRVVHNLFQGRHKNLKNKNSKYAKCFDSKAPKIARATAFHNCS